MPCSRTQRSDASEARTRGPSVFSQAQSHWLPNRLNFFHASGDFCCLLITLANSLDPDQDRQIVSPDLDPNRLKLSVQFLEKVKFEKSQPTTTKA